MSIEPTLIYASCIDILPTIPDRSIDLVCCDPPYGTTQCKWDTPIPLDFMWAQLRRIAKPNAAIILTASQPFTSRLVASNFTEFRYELIWVKDKPSNFALAKRQPLKYHENICVFYRRQPTYNRIMEPRRGSGAQRVKYPVDNSRRKSDHITLLDAKKMHGELRNPGSVREVSTGNRKHSFHPTQKPVALIEWLVRTYSDPGDTVLDFAMGSGTTGIACRNSGRHFIGIEMNEAFYDIARMRTGEGKSSHAV